MTERICLLIPYFGDKWPSYFELFLWSCDKPLPLDILIFTNLEEPSFIPDNTKFHPFTLERFNQLASQKLGLKISLKSGYKLCDLKPAFGLIFEDYISGYDIWGWGDLDLIYGDLQKYIPDCISEDIDVFSFHPLWVSGAFFLLRNNYSTKHLFKKSATWIEAFQRPEFVGFDECYLLWERIRKGEDILKIDKKESFSYVLRQTQKKGEIRAVWLNKLKESIPLKDFLVASKELGIRDGHEKSYLLYHFITEKKEKEFTFPKWKNYPKKFYITKTGFYTEEVFHSWKYWISSSFRQTLGFFKELNRLRRRLYEKIFNERR